MTSACSPHIIVITKHLNKPFKMIFSLVYVPSFVLGPFIVRTKSAFWLLISGDRCYFLDLTGISALSTWFPLPWLVLFTWEPFSFSTPFLISSHSVFWSYLQAEDPIFLFSVLNSPVIKKTQLNHGHWEKNGDNRPSTTVD